MAECGCASFSRFLSLAPNGRACGVKRERGDAVVCWDKACKQHRSVGRVRAGYRIGISVIKQESPAASAPGT